MKKKSTYEIEGQLYEFNNNRLKQFIQMKNPNRGAFEQFYRKVVSKNVGISYDTVKGWVKNDTNPAIEDVKTIAEILEIPYMNLLDCTHYSVDTVRTRIQKIRFEEVLNPFSLKYNGFSNALDMIIGMGYNPKTGECIDSDFAERIISIIGSIDTGDYGLPELLGYKFIYTEDELRSMTNEDLVSALNSGYVDDEGNILYDKDYKLHIDRKKFGERLIKNTFWLDDEERKELKEVIDEVDEWWDYCEMPFGMLKIDINFCGERIASYTYGQGWIKPTHEDRWTMILDILSLLGTRVDATGLCGIHEMYVDQFESEVFLTIEVFEH